jgi:DNA-binding transcriptional LysR family regulator
MELRQLRYFVVLAKELNFTRAAEKLFVSQPPLSLQIANLELELGSKLFYRTSRSVKLSEAGQIFLMHCQAILERLDQACDHVKQVEKGLEGQVQIGLSGSHFMGPLPYFIGEFRTARPQVEIILRAMKPSDHLRSLSDTGVDISVLRNPSEHPDLSAKLLWRDPVMAVLPLNHRLARKRKIHLKELRDESMVLLHPESSAYAQSIFDACIAEGFVPRVAQHVIEMPAMANWVAAGLGVALAPASIAHIRKDEIVFRALSDTTLSADVYAMTRRHNNHPAVHEFLNALTTWAKGSALKKICGV